MTGFFDSVEMSGVGRSLFLRFRASSFIFLDIDGLPRLSTIGVVLDGMTTGCVARMFLVQPSGVVSKRPNFFKERIARSSLPSFR